MAAAGGRDAVKVKIIDTEYVYTDPMSFKTVVQKLTGKDAEVNKGEASAVHNSTARPAASPGGGELEKTGGVAVGSSREFLSQEDFDRLLKEMPSVDELCRIWADS